MYHFSLPSPEAHISQPMSPSPFPIVYLKRSKSKLRDARSVINNQSNECILVKGGGIFQTPRAEGSRRVGRSSAEESCSAGVLKIVLG